MIEPQTKRQLTDGIGVPDDRHLPCAKVDCRYHFTWSMQHWQNGNGVPFAILFGRTACPLCKHFEPLDLYKER